MAGKVYLGKSFTDFTESPQFDRYTKVVLIVKENEDGTQTVYEAGSDGGRTLEVTNPWGTQAIADYILSQLGSYQYKPYTADGAVLDVAAEIGDGVTVNGIYSLIAEQSTGFDALSPSSISAPLDEEMDHEYPYESAESREIKRRIAASAEAVLSITNDAIDLKVSKGDVSSQISVESGAVSIRSGRMTIDSTNFKVAGNGSVTASGNFTTTSGSQKTVVNSGGLNLYYNSSLTGRILGSVGAYASGTTGTVYPVTTFHSDSNGIVFVNSSDSIYYYAFNTGLNPGGYTERNYLDNVRVINGLYVDKIRFGNSSSDIGWDVTTLSNSPEGVSTHGNCYVSGNFRVYGTKNRVVETDHYGTVALNAVESAAALFCDCGSVQLDETGKGYVYFDPVFYETIDSVHDYQVFLTSTSDKGSGYAEKSTDHFIVHGPAGATFDWIVYARQKNYANHRLETIVTEKEPYEDSTVNTDAIFYQDGISANQTERYMSQFEDTIDELAELYLENYEREVNDYDD